MNHLNESKTTLEWVERCPHCDGSGLYVGMGEMASRPDYGGAAVVCRPCGGTGRLVKRHEYHEFKGRLESTEPVRTVWACNPGIMLHPDFFSGGVPLAEWQTDPLSVHQSGAEMRSHTCPAWWNQTADKPKPKWNECIVVGAFSQCQHFDQKAQCWTRLDQEREALRNEDEPCGICGGLPDECRCVPFVDQRYPPVDQPIRTDLNRTEEQA